LRSFLALQYCIDLRNVFALAETKPSSINIKNKNAKSKIKENSTTAYSMILSFVYLYLISARGYSCM
ncbi:MAG: hypothetical protein JSU99_02910, partial [Nitrospiraceae bacterium]